MTNEKHFLLFHMNWLNQKGYILYWLISFIHVKSIFFFLLALTIIKQHLNIMIPFNRVISFWSVNYYNSVVSFVSKAFCISYFCIIWIINWNRCCPLAMDDLKKVLSFTINQPFLKKLNKKIKWILNNFGAT